MREKDIAAARLVEDHRSVRVTARDGRAAVGAYGNWREPAAGAKDEKVFGFSSRLFRNERKVAADDVVPALLCRFVTLHVNDFHRGGGKRPETKRGEFVRETLVAIIERLDA